MQMNLKGSDTTKKKANFVSPYVQLDLFGFQVIDTSDLSCTVTSTASVEHPPPLILDTVTPILQVPDRAQVTSPTVINSTVGIQVANKSVRKILTKSNIKNQTSQKTKRVEDEDSSDDHKLDDASDHPFSQQGTIKYLNSLDEYSLLTHEEELELARRCQEGDKKAMEQLIHSNLKLVVHIARKYVNKPGMAFDDVIQEGNIGLMTAALKYDNKFDVRFSTYAVPWINQKIKRAFKTKSRTIYIPSHVTERIVTASLALNRAKSTGAAEDEITKLEEKLEEVTAYELGADRHLLSQSQGIASLDEKVMGDEDGQPSLGDIIADSAQNPEMRAEVNQTIEILIKAMKIFSPLDLTVFQMRSGLNDDLETSTIKDVSTAVGYSAEWVRQRYPVLLSRFMKEVSFLTGGLDNLSIKLDL